MNRYAVFVLLASGCGGSVLRPLVSTDAERDLEQITRSTSDERAPAISPDSKALSYEVDGERHHFHIWRLRVL